MKIDKVQLPQFTEPIEILKTSICECCGRPVFLSTARAKVTVIRNLQPGTKPRWRHLDGFQHCRVKAKLEDEDYKKAQEIAKKSITEMVEMQDKAKKYDELEPRLEDLVDEFRQDESLGSYELHLFEQIESIITSDKRSQETHEKRSTQ